VGLLLVVMAAPGAPGDPGRQVTLTFG